MNENFHPRRHTEPLGPETLTLWQREEFLRWECGRLLRRELGLYIETEPALRPFRLHRALDELRLIQIELETILKEETDRN